MTKYSLHCLRLVLAFALLAGQLTHAASPAETMMSTLFDGPPRRASENLHMDAYVKVRLQKLANARIAYINWSAIGDMLRKMGYAHPPTELTPELAKAILDRAGFAGKVADEPDEAFLNEFRVLWAIRYGGHLINWNFGSGRNAAEGMLDAKGVIRTELVRPWADAGHSDGTMALFECMKEAYWGNILHQILPHGANRVVFIVTTGTTVNKAYSVDPRAVAFREDPERPAYWQPNLAVSSENMSEKLRAHHMEGDRRRMERLLPTLTQALPMPKNFPANATAPQRLHAGLFEFIDRLSHQYTTAYARQISLAGASTSNTEFSKALDFGSTSGLIGFPRVQLASGEVPNGTPDSLRTDIVLEFAQDLRTVLPPELLVTSGTVIEAKGAFKGKSYAIVTPNFVAGQNARPQSSTTQAVEAMKQDLQSNRVPLARERFPNDR